MSADRNKLEGSCGSCGATVGAGQGFFVRAPVLRILCAPCHAGPPPVPRVTPSSDRVKATVYWNHKIQRAILVLKDVVAPTFELVRRGCEAHSFVYSSEIKGWGGPIELVPALIDALGQADIRVEVSENAAQALVAKAEQNKKAVAGASVRLVHVGKQGKTIKEFQKRGVEYIAPRSVVLLSDDGGLGKTMQILSASGPRPRLLVVAPKIMVGAIVDGRPVGGWAEEAATWRPDIEKITIVQSREEFRWPEENEIVLLNYELMPVSPVEIAKEAEKESKARREAIAKGLPLPKVKPKNHVVAPEPPEGVELVADEAHAFANPNSQRSKRFRHLKNLVLKKGGKVRGVTATPMKNNAKELYAVLDAIGAAEIAFGSFKNYAKLHDYQPKQVAKNKVTWEFNDPSPEVAERLRRVMLRRKKRDVLTELPPLTIRRLLVDVDREAMRACDSAMNEIVRAGLDVEKAMELVDESRAGGLDFTKISAALSALAKVKAPFALERAIEYERTGTPVVFFAAHLSVIEALGLRKGWGCLVGGGEATANYDGKPVKTKGPEVAHAFQNSKLDNIAATIQYAGVGINLTRSSEAFMVEQMWNPAMNAQAIWRIERIGQFSAMLVNVLVANHPLDIRMCEVLEKKLAHYAATVDAAAVAPEDLDRREDVVSGYLEAAKKTTKRAT